MPNRHGRKRLTVPLIYTPPLKDNADHLEQVLAKKKQAFAAGATTARFWAMFVFEIVQRRVADKGEESSLFPFQGKEGAAKLVEFIEESRDDDEVNKHLERLKEIIGMKEGESAASESGGHK